MKLFILILLAISLTNCNKDKTMTSLVTIVGRLGQTENVWQRTKCECYKSFLSTEVAPIPLLDPVFKFTEDGKAEYWKMIGNYKTDLDGLAGTYTLNDEVLVMTFPYFERREDGSLNPTKAVLTYTDVSVENNILTMKQTVTKNTGEDPEDKYVFIHTFKSID